MAPERELPLPGRNGQEEHGALCHDPGDEEEGLSLPCHGRNRHLDGGKKAPLVDELSLDRPGHDRRTPLSRRRDPRPASPEGGAVQASSRGSTTSNGSPAASPLDAANARDLVALKSSLPQDPADSRGTAGIRDAPPRFNPFRNGRDERHRRAGRGLIIDDPSP